MFGVAFRAVCAYLVAFHPQVLLSSRFKRGIKKREEKHCTFSKHIGVKIHKPTIATTSTVARECNERQNVFSSGIDGVK